MTHNSDPFVSAPPFSRAHRVCELSGTAVRFADRTVLRDINLTIGPAARFAVIGDNAAGKSTLLGMLAGTVPLSEGERRVALPGGLALAEQAPHFADHASVSDAIDALLAEVRQLELEIAELSNSLSRASAAEQPALLGELGEAMARFDARDGYGVDQRVAEAMQQLGLGGIDASQSVHTLSGGERARLALAAAVSSEAELLLLDEPTNDLDDDAVAWLEDRLARHQGAMVVVTHDRAFLDRFATDIIHVEAGSLRRYGDGYRGFLTARAAERQRMITEYEAWKHDLTRNRELVVSNAFRLDAIPRKMERAAFGHGAFRARGRDHGAMSRIRIAKERVSRLLAEPAPRPADPLSFQPSFDAESAVRDPSCTAARDAWHEPLIVAEGVQLVNPKFPRLMLNELTVEKGDRILITGPNGAGKTTLLRVLAGELEPDRGTVVRRGDLRIAWLRQDLVAGEPQSLQEAFATAIGDYLDDATERLLDFGLFQPDDLRRSLTELSVGQRRRFELAVVLTAQSQVLLLDEPTNHLSPDLVEQFEAALAEYTGAVITVTHDRSWRAHAMSHSSTRHIRVGPGGECDLD